MAQLGFRTLDEMIGRVDRLDFTPALDHWKARGLDYSAILYQPPMPQSVARRCVRTQDHGLEKALDTTLIARCAEALEQGTPVAFSQEIRNVNRTVGTMLGYELTSRWGGRGLPDDTIRVHFTGSAGQSFGAFLPRGISFTLEGDANDYWGKGLSGGRLTVFPPRASTFAPEDNIVIGNVALYGATSGEAYVRGVAGERFAVRNSGAHAVVEGVGDHGCEYMTGGRVVVLGRTGRNFAAGMSGGIAYVLDRAGDFRRRCNPGMVDLEPLERAEDIELVRALVRRHVDLTGSTYAARILDDWVALQPRFVVVMPRDLKRVLRAEARARAEGREPTFAELVGATSG
jgi:glutamate synthase (ferredoxin)